MKVLLLGMNNPHREGDPLSPHDGAGRRLFEISGMSLDAYEQEFERQNLLESRRWLRVKARAAWRRIDPRGYRAVVFLGREVAMATGFSALPFYAWTVLSEGVPAASVPHPSGLSRAYNDPENRESARETLLRARRGVGCESAFFSSA